MADCKGHIGDKAIPMIGDYKGLEGEIRGYDRETHTYLLRFEDKCLGMRRLHRVWMKARNILVIAG